MMKWLVNFLASREDQTISSLGVKVRNMKMDFTIYGTWRYVG